MIEVSVAELGDVNKARLVFQCDIEDGVGQSINYVTDENLNLPVPMEMVDGADEGIRHSVRITNDLFATGSDPRLVNFKTYYYICISYGYNNYEDYDPALLTGQAAPYLRGRKAASGSIRSYFGIPHRPDPENGGTVQNSAYGDEFPIERIEGQGNGGQRLVLDAATVDLIVNGAPWRQDDLQYLAGGSPVSVKVVDPLNVPAARFELWLQDSTGTSDPDELADAYWKLVNLDSATTGGAGTVYSDRSIAVENEQLILDWGISVTITQQLYDGSYTDFLGADIAFSGEPWFSGVPDGEGQDDLNWIWAGLSNEDGNSYNDYPGKDDEENYEGVLVTDVWTSQGGCSGWHMGPLAAGGGYGFPSGCSPSGRDHQHRQHPRYGQCHGGADP